MIVISGNGQLADLVYKQLSSDYGVTRQDLLTDPPDGTKLALVLHDNWQPSVHQQAEEKFRKANIPWLRGFVSFGEGVIGPFVQPGERGCSRCADVRYILAGSDSKEMWGLYYKLSGENRQQDSWASRTGLLQMTSLLCAEVAYILQGKPHHLNNQLLITNLKTLMHSSHHFSFDPTCPICGDIPEDTAELAEIKLQSSPKIQGAGYRCRSIEELENVLLRDYYDHRTGVINRKMQDWTLPFADVLMNMPLFGASEGVAGRSNSYRMSELTAILEGLERYCGIEPKGKRRAVRKSYQDVMDKALDPATVGLHEDYEKPHFPYQPFDPKKAMNWVWGYSFLQERSLLVPELLAYYSLGGGEGFVYETSNGCAIGGSLEEAIFHGIMEVVERDSFLLTFYAKLSLPRLDLSSAGDKELQLMVDRVREVAGYDLYFYNSTMEHGIPSVWALAKNRKETGVNIICAAGAHLDPVRAVKSAIYELAGTMFVHDEKFSANRQKYEEMLKDPFKVRTMEDHGMLYGLPEAEEYLAFILNDHRPLRTFAEEFKKPPVYTDLKDDLEEVLQTFRDNNLEVIVVDQTTPIIQENGLYCVKVIIPGMLPMTFGHHLTRVKGLDRVLEVPKQLGYTEKTLAYEELNPFPHPFP